MLFPSVRVRRIIYNVGGGAVVFATWVNPGPGMAAMSLAVLGVLFLLAMLSGPKEEPTTSLTEEPHACMDDELFWDEHYQQYQWMCPHSNTLI